MERRKADLILENLSTAINNLELACKNATQSYGLVLCSTMVDDYSGSRVALLKESWLQLCGIDREYSVEVHGGYDKEEPWEQRTFRLWFKHEGVMYFCLMSGKEVLANGCRLPSPELPDV